MAPHLSLQLRKVGHIPQEKRWFRKVLKPTKNSLLYSNFLEKSITNCITKGVVMGFLILIG